ncbi:hypothetical protein V8E51_016359 [Hyaloscypha variabilis]
MPRTTQTVFSEGIFHGLPTFPDHDGKKYTAIVTGANGISGSEIVDVLASSPERWETIYALSRKPPVNKNPHVKTIAADFLSSPEELAALFKKEGIKADYIFFASYLQPPTPEGAGVWSNADDLETVNVTLLSNFLSALTISQIIPKRFLLQTGGKHYGIHVGPATVPQTEGLPSDRVPHSNFYFPQEDLLSEWSTKHNTTWTVTRPGFILGAHPTAFINIAYALALYISISKALGKKELDFPADIPAWEANRDNTTARLIGYFSEWAVLTEAAANEAFNLVDDSPFSYGRFWPEVAGWYGLSAGRPDSNPENYQTITLGMDPPPRGFGGPGVVKVTFSFEGWASRPEVKEAWEKLREKEGLTGGQDPWAGGKTWLLKDIFGSLDAEILGGWSRTMTMDKAKSLGWHGHVRTGDGFRDTIEKMAELKMVPGF